MEAQSGYVELGGRKAAHLSLQHGALNLQVTESDASFGAMSPADVDLLSFHGSRNGFTLVGLQHKSSQARLGVGGTTTYSVQLALEDVHYENIDEISGRSWLVYVEDQARIAHVSGLQQSIMLPEDGPMILTWVFKAAAATVLRCPRAGLELHLGQDMRTGGDPINGPSMSFRYSARVELQEELKLKPALSLLNRIRLFFSLLMGRVLAIEEVALRLKDGDTRHDARILGLIPTTRDNKPTERIVSYADTDELARMLDVWLERYDDISEAVHLHMDGLEQRRLPIQLRFQLFVQALEALHRRTMPSTSAPVDVAGVREALREVGLAGDVVDRVSGVLAHAHEPGLRQRLKSYWDQFASELAVLRPEASRSEFVGRVVATRNHLAHRTDRDSQVLEGGDLWDHTETVKAISHMALVAELGGNVAGLGRAMLDRRFAEYVIQDRR